MSDFLTAEEVISIQDLPFEDVVIPEWNNKKVRVMSMNAEESSSFGLKMSDINSDEAYRYTKINMFRNELLSRTLFNDNNEKLFDTPEKVALLGKKNPKVLKRLSDIAVRLNGIGEDAKEVAIKN
ncbi:MAG: hypothetical protein M1282_04590 [Chloroflexi bacterium]|nr:hypothetical protein [Chloroflexota bacterium]